MRLKKIFLTLIFSCVAVLPFVAQSGNDEQKATVIPLKTSKVSEEVAIKITTRLETELNLKESEVTMWNYRDLNILEDIQELQSMQLTEKVKEVLKVKNVNYLIIGNLNGVSGSNAYNLDVGIYTLDMKQIAVAKFDGVLSDTSYNEAAKSIADQLFAPPKAKGALSIVQKPNEKAVTISWERAADRAYFSKLLKYEVLYSLYKEDLSDLYLVEMDAEVGMDWSSVKRTTFNVPDANETYYFTVIVKNPFGIRAMYDVVSSTGKVVKQATTTSSSTTSTSQNIKPDFKLVEGGTFQMGSTSGDSDEKPVHSVTVTSFYMCDHEVTQKEYRDVMGTNPSYYKGDSRPVEQVTWFNAIEYCNALSRKEGLTPCYTQSGGTWTCNFNADGYRLPAEAEWEYAARGGKKSNGYTYSGSNNIDSVAWYTSTTNDTGTRDVKTKSPNELGLYDMSGNVWEWCWDWYGSYSSSSQTNPYGASSGSHRVQRGGGWGSRASYCRVANRGCYSPSYSYGNIGFRVVRSSSK